jgi:hypothetical protein
MLRLSNVCLKAFKSAAIFAFTLFQSLAEFFADAAYMFPRYRH